MLNAEQVRVVPGVAQDFGKVSFTGIQVVREAPLGESHHPVRVGVPSCPESCPGRTALGRGTEAVFEANSRCGEGIDVG